MNRRTFLSSIAAVAAASTLSRLGFAQTGKAHLDIDFSQVGASLPEDFSGLSYETAQLANPAFFSAKNKELIELFRGLSPNGVLRIGGGSSEYSEWSEETPSTPPPFEVFGPDTSKTVKHGTTNTRLAIENLRDFLDATGWRCIYGLNLGQGTAENAAKEAAAVCKILGKRLIVLQIGNEPDSFRNRYRPASYSPADFVKEWKTFHDAIVAKVPDAKFAGPDISNKIAYLTAFATEAPKFPDVTLLTAHFYAMGPARSPKATLEKLLVADPSQQTMSEAKLTTALNAAKQAHLPFRLCEGNSCWDGGKPGVSDTLASALWSADYMLQIGQMGVCGINFHGGGNGFYTPIAGAPSTGFSKRPEYYGMQFAQRLVGGSFVKTTLQGAKPTLTAYALSKSGKRFLVVVNKSDESTQVSLPTGIKPHGEAILLTGEAFDSKAAPDYHSIAVSKSSTLSIPARSATLYTL